MGLTFDINSREHAKSIPIPLDVLAGRDLTTLDKTASEAAENKSSLQENIPKAEANATIKLTASAPTLINKAPDKGASDILPPDTKEEHSITNTPEATPAMRKPRIANKRKTRTSTILTPKTMMILFTWGFASIRTKLHQPFWQVSCGM
jgi:hypothetical protein